MKFFMCDISSAESGSDVSSSAAYCMATPYCGFVHGYSTCYGLSGIGFMMDVNAASTYHGLINHMSCWCSPNLT